MNLKIDTAEQSLLRVAIDGEIFLSDSKKEKSQLLLPFILERLEESGFSTFDITSIDVACGPGSFTGLRVGASVAQALAWSLNVSLNGQLGLYSIKLMY